ncbi:CBS domain-containing protein [Halodurantibacterium flavum]|uniref:CBS domain-containing protein n=1 Tax=Halodurantibacterium flavum TaxID=1382802 RepID=A0ABW4S4L6_9RHOB
MLVRQILNLKDSSEVLSVGPDDTVAEAARRLSQHRIGSLVVMRDGEVAGIISERDIVRELGRRGQSCLDDPVQALMTARVVSCQSDDSADAVLERMTEGRFRHMPVMEDGRMVGLISIGDVVKARLSELHMEKSALEGMIMGH